MNLSQLQQKAESGSVVAQSMLGLCYLYGREVEVDYKEAFRLLSLAKDKKAAQRWYSAAAAREDGVDDSVTAAFLGALTFDEIQEAKIYVASVS